MEHVKDYTSKIGAKLRLKGAILDLVATNESENANNSACKDLRDLFKEMQGLTAGHIAQILASEITPGGPKDDARAPTLVHEIYKSSQLICDQLFTLQCQQLKVWDYENMQERCANYLQTLNENQQLKRNLKLYHEGDFLRSDSLKNLHNQLELLRDDNRRLQEQNEKIEWTLKAAREQNDSYRIREAISRNLREREQNAKVVASKLGRQEGSEEQEQSKRLMNTKHEQSFDEDQTPGSPERSPARITDSQRPLQDQSEELVFQFDESPESYPPGENEINFVESLKKTKNEDHQQPPKAMEFPVTDEEEAILSGLHHYLNLK